MDITDLLSLIFLFMWPLSAARYNGLCFVLLTSIGNEIIFPVNCESFIEAEVICNFHQ